MEKLNIFFPLRALFLAFASVFIIFDSAERLSLGGNMSRGDKEIQIVYYAYNILNKYATESDWAERNSVSLSQYLQ